MLSRHRISHAQAAEELGVSRQYVCMMATGKTPPALALAFEIADWARAKYRDKVPVESWREFCKVRG